MHRFLLHNGEIRDTSVPLVSPGQTGYMNGWGVFSTVRVYDGVLFAFERHYARMKRDAALLHVPFDMSIDAFRADLMRLVEANDAINATLRVACVRNFGGIFEGTGIRRPVDMVAFTADLSSWGEGVKLSYVPNARHAASPFAGTKVTSWCQNLTWNEMAHEHGLDEVILLNEHGKVSECTSANIFGIYGNVVTTPPVRSSGCLPGVTRAVLIEEIRVNGLSFDQADLTPAELESADQIFITSTTRNLIPVLEIDGRPMRQSPEAFDSLSQAFSRYQAEYAQAHARARETLKP